MTSGPTPFTFDYGRKLGDFQPDALHQHPFELTLDSVVVGPYMASFIDASPLPSSDRFARALGLAKRPVSPHLLLNIGLSTSVHDVSQQAIAHLAYVTVSFPKPLPLGATVRGATRIIAAKPTSKGDKGVVHVQTVLVDEEGDRVLDFERKALVRSGNLTARPAVSSASGPVDLGRVVTPDFSAALADRSAPNVFRPALFGRFDELQAGQVFCHAHGRTVGESEHMQLSAICRNSHPLHWDAVYADSESFTGKRVVYGGLVLAWTVTQTSLDLGGHVAWEKNWRDGAHPAPVLAGDTIFSASKVLATRPINDWLGEVDLRTIGVKNDRPQDILKAGHDLFGAEREKSREARISAKVVEITRTVLVMR